MHFIAFIYVFWDLPITKMLSASFLFSAVFVSEKLHRNNSRNCTGQKLRQYFPVMYTETEGETKGDVEPPHHLAARVPPPTRREVVWGPQGSPGVRPSPIYTSSTENPKYPIIIPQKVPSLPSSSTLDREGSGALHGTLPEGRSSPEGSTSPCLPPV